MNLCFVTEARFMRANDGKIYAIDCAFGPKLWKRYLEAFDSIRIVARVGKDESFEPQSVNLIDLERVSFLELPYYVGPLQYLRKSRHIKTLLQKEYTSDYVYICRNGQLTALTVPILKKRNIPYAIEMVGDPWDVFSPGASRSWLRIFFRYWFLYRTRYFVDNAAAVLYVTQKSLQHRYPPRPNIPSFGVSDIMLPPEAFSNTPKTLPSKTAPVRLISVGSLEQPYKAPDIVLKSIRMLKDTKVAVRLTWLGDGRYMKEMLDLAKTLEINELVDFVGNISPTELVRDYLRNHDLFLLVSRVEGLPRALVEAMAIGLPCIGSRVGGIPELLDKNMLVPPGDAQALTDKIIELIQHPELANVQAELNLTKAHEYADEVLKQKRFEFFRAIQHHSSYNDSKTPNTNILYNRTGL